MYTKYLKNKSASLYSYVIKILNYFYDIRRGIFS